MTSKTVGIDNGGTSNSVSRTRVFFSKKYGVKVELRNDGFYVLSGLYGTHETRDIDVVLELVELYTTPKYSQLLSKRLSGE